MSEDSPTRSKVGGEREAGTDRLSLQESLEVIVALEDGVLPNLVQIELEGATEHPVGVVGDLLLRLRGEDGHDAVRVLGGHLLTKPEKVIVIPQTEEVAGLELGETGLRGSSSSSSSSSSRSSSSSSSKNEKTLRWVQKEEKGYLGGDFD